MKGTLIERDKTYQPNTSGRYHGGPDLSKHLKTCPSCLSTWAERGEVTHLQPHQWTGTNHSTAALSCMWGKKLLKAKKFNSCFERNSLIKRGKYKN